MPEETYRRRYHHRCRCHHVQHQTRFVFVCSTARRNATETHVPSKYLCHLTHPVHPASTQINSSNEWRSEVTSPVGIRTQHFSIWPFEFLRENKLCVGKRKKAGEASNQSICFVLMCNFHPNGLLVGNSGGLGGLGD